MHISKDIICATTGLMKKTQICIQSVYSLLKDKKHYMSINLKNDLFKGCKKC